MNIIPFVGIGAILFVKDKMGSFGRRNPYSDKYDKPVGYINKITRISAIMSKIKRLESVDFGGNKIINLCPHTVAISINNKVERIPRTEGYVRTSTKRNNSQLEGFGALDVRMPSYTSLVIHFSEGNRQSMGPFPPPNVLAQDAFFNNVYFLVSRIAANHMHEYNNILVVGKGGGKEIQDFLVEAQKICRE